MKPEGPAAVVKVKEETECTRMLGAHVDESLYWEFKQAVTNRKESMVEAITHAAKMYIDIKETK
jgi:hypothetical protein